MKNDAALNQLLSGKAGGKKRPSFFASGTKTYQEDKKLFSQAYGLIIISGIRGYTNTYLEK